MTAAIAGCTYKVPLYCDEETPCENRYPDRPFCDLNGDYPASEGIGRTCIPWPRDAGANPDAVAAPDAMMSDAPLADAGPPPTVLVAVANADEKNRVYEWNGTGFTLIWSSPDALESRDIAWADVDGDELPDLVVANANSSQANQIFRNTGSSFSLIWSSPETESSNGVVVSDFDKDLDIDIAFANLDEPSRVYWNESGTFNTSVTIPGSGRRLALADIDGDGDDDLALAGSGAITVVKNGGSSFSTEWSTNAGFPPVTGVAWANYDGDADIDLAVSLESSMQSRLYRDDGTQYSLAWQPSEFGNCWEPAWADYDSDTDQDLLFIDQGKNRLYKNSGGNFALVWSSQESDLSTSAEWFDVDNDGDPDLLVGNESSQKNRLYRNDEGTLVLWWSSPEEDNTWGIAATSYY